MFELYINDILMDISEESGDEIVLQLRQMSLDNIDVRAGDNSFLFPLPATSNNLSAIQSSEQVDNTTNYPYTKLKARAYKSGVDLRVRFAELVTISDVIEFRLYGGNADFFKLLGDLKIEDMDFTGQNHFWEYNQIVAYTNPALNNIFTYPIIYYPVSPINQYINNGFRIVHPKMLLPALKYRQVIERIVTDQGYTLVNEIDTDNAYKDLELCLPYSGGNFVRDKNGDRYKVKVGRLTEYNVSGISGGPQAEYMRWDKLFTPNDYFKPAYSNWTADIFPNTYNGIALADRCKISGNYSLILENRGAVDFVVVITLFSSNYFAGWGASNTKVKSVTVPAFSSITVTDSFIDLITGDEPFTDTDTVGIQLYFSIPDAPLFVLPGSTFEITAAEIIEQRPITYIEESTSFARQSQNFITLNSIFGDLKQIDLLIDYCKLFGLLIEVDNISKVVKLYRFDAIVKNLPNALDWSDKVDTSIDTELAYLNDTYGQKSRFLYQLDQYEEIPSGLTKDENPTGTQGEILIDNENLPAEADIVELKFAATGTTPKLVTDTLNWIRVTDAEGTPIESKTQRILFLDKITGGSGIIFSDFDDSLDTVNDYYLTWFIDASKTVNLGFETDLLNRNYESLRRVMQNYKMLKIALRLNAADINQLDFKKPIYLSQHASYFYIQSVTDYSPTKNESTMVELVKLNP